MIEGNEIVRRLQCGDKDKSLPHQLLRELFNGYPITELPKLFDSTDAEIVKTAAWIASELGARGTPILDATGTLLSHSSKYVRFFAIDSVLACATLSHAALIGDVVRLLSDPEPSVRWKAMDFLARIARDRLESTADSFSVDESPRKIVQTILELTLDTRPNLDAISSHLDGSSIIGRQIGAISAVRISSHSPVALTQALSNQDPDVRQFAESFRGTTNH